MSDVLATLSASKPRRLFGLGVLLTLGFGLIYLALARPPSSVGWQIFLIALGALSLVLGEKMRRATLGKVVLTAEGLFDGEGRVLAPIAEITGVDRGPFAMKPSHGFTVRLSTARGRGWAPGLWWRMGYRLGVGGVTPAAQAKVMSEALTVLLMERDG
ncbi:hypothetical protein [Actibacterium sp. MT2.3-13A]|uniref:hypothetical protein n=1 Tax=Actibacterium sp. MT2.3-13A TaxID=2828332 RepID=UPI001BA5C829|nr:hypothetical protein [Actibacterium sp. MT2.3-13A]